MPTTRRGSPFDRFARQIARLAGHPLAFAAAVAIIAAWALSGPLFGFSDRWQLVINSTTTIVTFIMVFVIQNTQNRDGEAIQIKLDELIRSLDGAHDSLLDLEELTESELEEIRQKYVKLAEEARTEIRKNGEYGTPDVDV
ncbi:MAG: low affinity iron permease family protein [Gaiellaceae bacterium]